MAKKIFKSIFTIVIVLFCITSCGQKQDTSYLKIQLTTIQQQHVDVIYNNLSTFIPADNSNNTKRIMLADYSGSIIITTRFYHGTLPSNPSGYATVTYTDIYYLITENGIEKTTVTAAGSSPNYTYFIGESNRSCKKTHDDVYFSTDVETLSREDIENTYKKMLAN